MVWIRFDQQVHNMDNVLSFSCKDDNEIKLYLKNDNWIIFKYNDNKERDHFFILMCEAVFE